MVQQMSAIAIAESLPKLSHEERRQIMALLLEVDQLASERFQTLDAMEAEDEKTATR